MNFLAKNIIENRKAKKNKKIQKKTRHKEK